MKIGIDCRTILNPGFGEAGGVGHYTYYLVKSLLAMDHVNEYVLFFDDRVVETASFEQSNVAIKFFPYSKYGAYLPYAYSQMLIAAFLQREHLDVYHSPANVIPSYYKGKTVQTVHDVSLFLHPEWYPSSWLSRQTLSWKTLFPSSIKRATGVIALSRSLADDIQRLFKIAPLVFKVIPEGFDGNGPHASVDHPSFEEVAQKYALEPKYLFFVGTIEPRKNLSALVKTFNQLLKDYPEQTKGLQLVIAGKNGHGLLNFQKEIDAVNKRFGMDVVKHVGYLLHEEKVCLLKHAVGFVSLSWYEGFGVPALEAMGLGCPVLVSDTAAFPEVVKDAGLYCDPRDTAGVIAGMLELLDPRKRAELVEKGKQRASQFSWNRAAKQTSEVYDRIFAAS